MAKGRAPVPDPLIARARRLAGEARVLAASGLEGAPLRDRAVAIAAELKRVHGALCNERSHVEAELLQLARRSEALASYQRAQALMPQKKR